MRRSTAKFETVVIGASLGGTEALEVLLPGFRPGFPAAICVVQHLSAGYPLNEYFVRLQKGCALPVVEAELGQPVSPGKIYFAPPGYHLLIERDHVFSLDSGERHWYARPSVDVLFESAADSYGKKVVGVVLTGANEDGAQGLGRIRQKGGYAIVQDPATAHASQMPKAAQTFANVVLPLEKIAPFLTDLMFTKDEENP